MPSTMFFFSLSVFHDVLELNDVHIVKYIFSLRDKIPNDVYRGSFDMAREMRLMTRNENETFIRASCADYNSFGTHQITITY